MVERMLGVVLAGGESRRMGRDKAGLPIGSLSFWERQRNVLLAAGIQRTVIIRKPGQPAIEGIECWHDLVADVGPLGGLHAALAPRAAAWVAVLAVDMPGIDRSWFDWLSRHCQPGKGAMAVHDQLFEPLAAIYPAEAMVEIEDHLQRHDHSLQSLARHLHANHKITVLEISPAEERRVASVNTPGELRHFEERPI